MHNNINIFPDNFERGFLEGKDFSILRKMYSEPSQTSKMELFAELVRGWETLNTFAKTSALDAWQVSEYVSKI